MPLKVDGSAWTCSVDGNGEITILEPDSDDGDPLTSERTASTNNAFGPPPRAR